MSCDVNLICELHKTQIVHLRCDNGKCLTRMCTWNKYWNASWKHREKIYSKDVLTRINVITYYIIIWYLYLSAVKVSVQRKLVLFFFDLLQL